MWYGDQWRVNFAHCRDSRTTIHSRPGRNLIMKTKAILFMSPLAFCHLLEMRSSHIFSYSWTEDRCQYMSGDLSYKIVRNLLISILSWHKPIWKLALWDPTISLCPTHCAFSPYSFALDPAIPQIWTYYETLSRNSKKSANKQHIIQTEQC